MDLEMAGTKTVLVNRWDKRQREAANGKSFGYEFEKATTRAAKGCEMSTGHHRIIKYVRLWQCYLSVSDVKDCG